MKPTGRKTLLTLLHGAVGVTTFTLGILLMLDALPSLHAVTAAFPLAGVCLILLLGLPNLLANGAVLAGRPFARPLCVACGILLLAACAASLFIMPFSMILLPFAAIGVLQAVFGYQLRF